MSLNEMPSRLSKLTVELTTDCNLKCDGCPRTVALRQGNWANLSMSLDNFHRLLSNIIPVDFVTLHGIGEPFLHPEFLEIVRAAKQSGKFRVMKVTTNGLTRTVNFMKEAVEQGLNEIWISVDSFDQIVANRMRRGSNVNKLKARVKDGIDAGLPIHISTVASHTNVRVLGRTLEELYQLGNPPVHIQEFQDFGDPSGILVPNERSLLVGAVKRVRDKYPDSKIHLPVFSLAPADICGAPWHRPAVTVEGFLTPCCTSFDPTHYSFSNIFENNYKVLWETAHIQSWLTKMSTNQVSMCNGCGLNPRNSGIDKSLERSGKSGREMHMMKVAS